MPTRPEVPGKTEFPPMAEPSRSSRKLAAVLVLLLCAGGGAWFFLSDDGTFPVEEAKRAVQSLTGSSGKDVTSVQAASEEASSGNGQAAVQEEKKSGEVSAAISTQPREAVSDPQAELLARVEKAMEESGPAMPGGHSVSGEVKDTPPAKDENRQDSVVTIAFVRDMARWLAAGYVPSHKEGRRGHSRVTLIQGNFRYSNSGTLRSVERDPLKGRSGVLNYVFTPGMLEALYRMYAPRLVEEMERAARNRGGHPLGDVQVADMFMVYAGEFQRLSVSLNAAAEVDLSALSAAIRRAAEKEAEANDDFARAYNALSLARESGNRDEVAVQGRRMEECTRVAGMYAARQERARADMLYALRRNADGRALSDAELVFLGEWLSRRSASVESIRAAAVVCGRMAGLCEQRAQDVLSPRTEEEPAPVSAPAPSPAAEKKPETSAPKAQPAAAEPSGAAAEPAVTPSSPKEQKTEAAPAPEVFVREVSGRLSFDPPRPAENPDSRAEAPDKNAPSPAIPAGAPQGDAAAAQPGTSAASGAVPSAEPSVKAQSAVSSEVPDKAAEVASGDKGGAESMASAHPAEKGAEAAEAPAQAAAAPSPAFSAGALQGDAAAAQPGTSAASGAVPSAEPSVKAQSAVSSEVPDKAAEVAPGDKGGAESMAPAHPAEKGAEAPAQAGAAPSSAISAGAPQGNASAQSGAEKTLQQ